jgi:hypothetical protein
MKAQLDQVAQRSRSLLAALPTNRAYLDALKGDAGRAIKGGA